ncbi:hypothetical protein AAHE18_14G066900 [Arachis hypogaea]
MDKQNHRHIPIVKEQKGLDLYLFAFIWYTTKGGAMKAVADMKSMVLRRKRLFIAGAKYRKRAIIRNTEGKEETEITGYDGGVSAEQTRSRRVVEEKVVKQQSVALIKEPNKNGWTKKLEVPIANENVTWLQRSIVRGMKSAINFQALRQKIHRNWPGVT